MPGRFLLLRWLGVERPVPFPCMVGVLKGRFGISGETIRGRKAPTTQTKKPGGVRGARDKDHRAITGGGKNLLFFLNVYLA